MATKSDVLLVKFETDGEGKVRASLNGVSQSIAAVDKQGALAAASMSQLKGALAGLVGIGALVQLGKYVGETTANYQRLNAALVTVTGSSTAASAAFSGLQAFAAKTPFQLTEVVDAFIKLKARGLDPSEAALRSYGNTAGATGKTLDQVIEAVGDAATGEFERLKEFGIVARAQGEQIQFTFQGVTTAVQRDAESIEGYLRKLGDVQFAGGMERQAATLGGVWSNLVDSTDKAAASIGNALSPLLISLTKGLTAVTDNWSTFPGKIEAAGESASRVFAAMGEDANQFAEDFFSNLDLIGYNAQDAFAKVGNEILILPQSLRTAITVMIGEADQLRISFIEKVDQLTISASSGWLSMQESASIAALEIKAFFASAIDAIIKKYADLIGNVEMLARGAGLTSLANDMAAFSAQLNGAAALENNVRTEIKATTDAYAARQAELSTLSQSIKANADIQRGASQDAIDAAMQERTAELGLLNVKKDAEAVELSSTAKKKTATATTKDAAAAARERTKAEKEAADELKRNEASLKSLIATLDPAAAALAEYSQSVQLLATAQSKGAFDPKEMQQYLEVLQALLKKELTGIKEAKAPFDTLLKNLQEELDLMKLSNVEREVAIALRDMEGEVTEEQTQKVRAAITALHEEAKTQEAAAQWGDIWREEIASVTSALVESFKKGGGSAADALGDAIKGSLDQSLDRALDKFADELSGLMSGREGASAEGVGAAARDAGLSAVGSIGASYVGGTSSMGQSVLGGAAAGAAYGAMYGSIIPVIGTAVGAVVGGIIGAIVGAVSAQNPVLEVSSTASGINRGKVEGSAQSAFGQIFVGKDDLTLGGNMSSQELADKIAEFDNTIAGLLDAVDVEAARSALANFDINQRGFNVSPEEVLALRFEAVVQAVEPAWAQFLDGISNLQDRVDAFQGLRTLRDQVGSLDELIADINRDPFEQLRFAIHNLDKAVTDSQAAFDAAITNQDPAALAEASSQLSQAVMRRYQAEIDMVTDLTGAIGALEQQTRAFQVNIAQRLAGVGGSAGAVVSATANNLVQVRGNVLNARDTEQALQHLDEFVSSVDQWLQATRNAVQQWHAEQSALLAQRLTDLDTEYNSIVESANARGAAEAAYQSQVQAMQQAAADAERDRLQGLLDIAQRWVGVLDQAQSLIDELTRGSANPLDGASRLGIYDVEIQKQRDNLATASDSERAGIAENLTGLLNDRLQLAQSLYARPSGEYLNIYNNTLRELGEIRDMAVDPAARAAELQAELNALQQGTTDAVNNFSAQSASFTGAEQARLDEIEAEREAIAEAQRLLDEEATARLAAIDDEARGYYEWAQTEGERLLAERHADLTARLDALTGGLPVDEFIAQQQERAATALEDIRDSIGEFLSLLSSNVAGSGAASNGGGSVSPTPYVRGGGVMDGGGSEAPVTLSVGNITINSPNGDPQQIQQAVTAALQAKMPQFASQLKREMKVA